MFTNEPSTQQPELPTERAGLPEEYASYSFPPAPATPETGAPNPWLNLLFGILTWFGSVLLLVFVPLIVTIPYFIYLFRTHGMPRPEALATDKTFLFISILGILPTHLLTLLLVWVVVTEWRQRPFWKTVGFEWPKETNPLIATGLCVLTAGVLLAIGFVVTNFWGGSKTQLDLLVESSIPARLATAFVAVFTAPLVEELVYRGVLYTAIERALGRVIAIFAVSLLFAGVHVFQYINNIAVITVITLLSFTLTFVRSYTGKLLPSFVIHLVFNGVQSLIIALAPFLGSGSS